MEKKFWIIGVTILIIVFVGLFWYNQTPHSMIIKNESVNENISNMPPATTIQECFVKGIIQNVNLTEVYNISSFGSNREYFRELEKYSVEITIGAVNTSLLRYENNQYPEYQTCQEFFPLTSKQSFIVLRERSSAEYVWNGTAYSIEQNKIINSENVLSVGSRIEGTVPEAVYKPQRPYLQITNYNISEN